MSRPRFRARLLSVQGFLLRRVSMQEARHLVDLDQAQEVGELTYQLTNYERQRDSSPSCITSADMRMHAGLNGDPLPMEKRRDGYIDPIEAAHEKVKAWPTVGDVKKEIVACYCPLPLSLTHKSWGDSEEGEALVIRHTESYLNFA